MLTILQILVLLIPGLLILTRIINYKRALDLSRYTFNVTFVNDEYFISCEEFPYCKVISSNRNVAFQILERQIIHRIDLMFINFEPFPKKKGIVKRTRFFFPFRQVWYSPCSNHYGFSHTCNLCRKGNWVFKNK